MADTKQEHVCSKCNETFASEEGYLEHQCETTGFAPTEPAHQGPEFLAVQLSALERGKDRVDDGSTAEAKQDAAIADVQEAIEALPDEVKAEVFGTADTDASDDKAIEEDQVYHAG